MYMLDTDTSSYVLKYKPQQARERFKQESGNIGLSEIVLAELLFGAARLQQRSAEIAGLIDTFASKLRVYPWSASSEYASLRTHLESQGTPIGNNDTLIAAHALQTGAVLVTNNMRQFERVPHLQLENWLVLE